MKYLIPKLPVFRFSQQWLWCPYLWVMTLYHLIFSSLTFETTYVVYL